VQLTEIIPFVLLDMAVVIAAARLMGKLFARFRQPAVVGEILAGVMLGPTLLGLLPGDLDLVLFPPDVRPYLTVIAQLGLVLFMFIVGLEVNLTLIRERRRTASAVSLASVVLPFGLALLLAPTLHEHHGAVDGRPVSFPAFALFLGVAMAVTAFPVLARILTERAMHRTPTGVLALACAAIDDVLGWSLLAVAVAVVVGGSVTGVALVLCLTAIYALVMFLGVRPLLARLVARYRAAGRLTPDMLAVVLVGVLLSAYATDLVGVTAIFGAFVFGAVMPRAEPGLTREVLERLEQVSLLLLLPVFFLVAGLQVDAGAIDARGGVELVLILAVAIGGKLLGTAAAARLQRLPRRQATALGLLLNTRGLTEIVVLQVGLQLGVFDPELFTLMVIMALITTIMTEPLLRLVYPDRIVQREIAATERAELAEADTFTVLVAVSDAGPGDGERLAALGRGLLGRERPARVVLAKLLPQPPVALELASGLGTDLATITAAGGELRVLARRLETEAGPDSGVRCSVVARFSADFAADLAALAATVDADVLLVPEPVEREREAEPAGAVATLAAPVAVLPQVADAALAVVRFPTVPPPPEPVQVAVLTDASAGARAAVRLGAQLALHHGTPVALGGTEERRSGRRAAAAVQALRRHGIDAYDLPDGVVFHALLLPAGAEEPRVGAATTVLWVRPGSADLDDDLDQAVARVTTA
jgi:Kef-type K+ transport system membrane component KefB